MVDCSPIARETGVQSQLESYQRLKNWYLIPPCLTLSIIRYISRVKWNNQGKGVAPSPTPRCSSCLLYSHEQLYIHIYTQKHNDAITTSGHSSFDKYTSHFIRNGWKGLRKVMCDRWVVDWTKTETYWPPPSSSGHSSASFSFFWAAQPGTLGGLASLLRAGSHRSIWNTDFKLWTPTAWLPVSAGYIIVLRPLNSTRRQSRLSPDLFDRMHMLFTQVHISFDSLAGSEVNM